MPDALRRPYRIGRRVVRHVIQDDTLGTSAELAYRFFLAIFPFAIFVTALGGFIASRLAVENPAQQAVDSLAGILPQQASSLVQGELQRVIDQQNAGLLSFAAVGALFFATGGTNALVKAMNRAYKVDETRPFWRRYLMALGMTLLAGTGLIAAFVLFVGGQFIGTDLAEQVGLGAELWTAITILRWPLSVALLILAVLVLYRLAPNVKVPLRWILPGAVLFAVGWLVATWLFGFYVSTFASYGSTYGALAGVAILLIWFYMTAFILLLGGAFNESLLHVMDRRELEERREVPEREKAEMEQHERQERQQRHASASGQSG